jgi:hypothetical protein
LFTPSKVAPYYTAFLVKIFSILVKKNLAVFHIMNFPLHPCLCPDKTVILGTSRRPAAAKAPSVPRTLAPAAYLATTTGAPPTLAVHNMVARSFKTTHLTDKTCTSDLCWGGSPVSVIVYLQCLSKRSIPCM